MTRQVHNPSGKVNQGIHNGLSDREGGCQALTIWAHDAIR